MKKATNLKITQVKKICVVMKCNLWMYKNEQTEHENERRKKKTFYHVKQR